STPSRVSRQPLSPAREAIRVPTACNERGVWVMLEASPTPMIERTFLQFQVGSSAFGLPVSHVVEIVRVVAFSPVPSPSPNLLGLVNLRGRMVPVFDLCRALGLGDRPLSLRMYVVITEAAGETVGVLVDDVNDVVTV